MNQISAWQIDVVKEVGQFILHLKDSNHFLCFCRMLVKSTSVEEIKSRTLPRMQPRMSFFPYFVGWWFPSLTISAEVQVILLFCGKLKMLTITQFYLDKHTYDSEKQKCWIASMSVRKLQEKQTNELLKEVIVFHRWSFQVFFS